MRVAIVQQHVDTRRGGAETSTVEMARHLARLGLDVTILCAGAGAPSLDENVRIVPLPVHGPGKAGRALAYLRAVGAACRVQRFDIVHAVTPCLSANVYQPRGGTYPETIRRTLALVRSPALRAVKRLGRRFNIAQRFFQRIEWLMLNREPARVHVAALSDYVRRQVVEGLGFPAERVRIVFNGVDIEPLGAAERAAARRELRRELTLDESIPLVLFAAHNFRLKGLRELLQAAASDVARAGGWRLVVAGRDEPGPYESLTARMGIAGRVRFVGTTTPLRQWYAAADVLAHPTWYDPCSRVVIEALSLGLPVVTTRYNGAAEVLEAGRHGVVVDDPADVIALVGAIGGALSPELRAACAADAERMHEKLSMARHARELADYYRSVV